MRETEFSPDRINALPINAIHLLIHPMSARVNKICFERAKGMRPDEVMIFYTWFTYNNLLFGYPNKKTSSYAIKSLRKRKDQLSTLRDPFTDDPDLSPYYQDFEDNPARIQALVDREIEYILRLKEILGDRLFVFDGMNVQTELFALAFRARGFSCDLANVKSFAYGQYSSECVPEYAAEFNSKLSLSLPTTIVIECTGEGDVEIPSIEDITGDTKKK